jgi:hypothetical protein
MGAVDCLEEAGMKEACQVGLELVLPLGLVALLENGDALVAVAHVFMSRVPTYRGEDR